MPNQDSSRDYDLLDRLVEEFNDRFRRGERPSVKEYCDRYPAIGNDLRELLPAVAQVEHAKEAASDNDGPVAPPVAAPLEHLGDFHILREIGHGGMGVVYEAEQVSLGRRVALKVLTQGLMRKDKQKRRFEREAKAAAKLHHSNIVPVFGTGEENGIPYYVMQFIQGMGLDAVVDELARMGSGGASYGPTVSALRQDGRDVSAAEMARSLMTGEFQSPSVDSDPAGADAGMTLTANPDAPVPAVNVFSRSDSHGRMSDTSGLSSSVTLPGQSDSAGRGRKLNYWQSVARIGVQVADALEYAHRQGVHHRDIKPSNLLLDLKGTVWVTDFGLAKAEGTDNLTQTGDILGTLRYMPPEAFDGKSDARSDVYSLGLTLYELAARRPAFEERNRQQLIKRVTTAEPARLQAVVAGVPRDLATIVEKAIEKDPARRYPTAAEFGADLQRFLDDEPILARRQTNFERYRRWARRNPGIAVMGGVLTAVLVLVTLGSLIVASRMTNLARNLAQSVDDERNARNEAVEAQKREEAERKKTDEALVKADKALQKAEENYTRSRAAVNDYLTAVSDDDRLKEPGLEPLREELLQSALAFYEEFLKERGNDPSLRRELADVYFKVGDVQTDLRRYSSDSYVQSQRLYELLLAQSPDDPDLQNSLAKVLQRRGLNREAMAIWEKLIRPDSPRYLFDLGMAYNAVATSFRANQNESQPNAADPVQELEYLRKALAVREQLVRLRPDDADARRGLAMSLNNIASAMTGPDRLPARLDLYRRAANESELAYKLKSNESNVRDVIRIVRNFANQAIQAGQFDEGFAAYERATEIVRKLGRDRPDHPFAISEGAVVYLAYAQSLHNQNQLEQAANVVRDGIGFLGQMRLRRDNYPYDAVRLRLLALMIVEARSKENPVAKADVERAAAAAVDEIRVHCLTGLTSASQMQNAAPLYDPLRQRADFRAVLNQMALLQQAIVTAQSTRTPAAARVSARRQCLLAYQALTASDPDSVIASEALADAHDGLAQASIAAGQLDEALASLNDALAIRQRLIRDVTNGQGLHLQLVRNQFLFSAALARNGRIADSIRYYSQFLSELEDRQRAHPKNVSLRSELARSYVIGGAGFALYGLWPEAIQRIRRGFEIQTPSEYQMWYGYAVLLLETGDEAGYRVLAGKALDQGSQFNRVDGLQRARVLLAAAPVSDRHHEIMKSIPDQFTLTRSESMNDVEPTWESWIRGFTSVRLGQAEKGLPVLQSANMREYQGLKWAALALAYHQLGRTTEAKESLEKADDFVARTLQAVVVGDSLGLTTFYEDWLLQRILRREAHRLIHGQPLPDSPYERLHRGRVLLALGEPDKADVEFAAAVALRPDDAETWLTRAQVFARLGRLEQRDADLAKALQLKTVSAQSWVAAGRTLAERGERDRADEAYSRAATATNDPNAFLKAGWWLSGPFARNTSYYLSGLAYMDQAVASNRQIDPAKPLEYLERTWYQTWKRVPSSSIDGQIDLSLLTKSHANEAYYCLNRVQVIDDRTATLLFRSVPGARLWVNGRAVYEEPPAAKEAPTQPVRIPLFLRKGRNTLLIKLSSGQANQPVCECSFEERPGPATDEFARFVEAEPNLPWRWIERGWYLAQQGRRDDAEKAFTRAVDQKPDDPAVFLQRGLAYADLGLWDESANDLIRVLELQPAIQASWLIQPGGVWDEIARRDELFARVIRKRPTLRQLWMQRVQFLGMTARLTEGMEAMKRILELDPDDAMTWHILPSIRLPLGDLEGYRKDCLAMRDRLIKLKDSLAVQRLATASLFTTHSSEVAADVLAKLIQMPKDQRSYGWHDAAMALAYYRTGQFDRADELLAGIPPGHDLAFAYNQAIRALVHFQRGRIDDARQCLLVAREAMSNYPRPGPGTFQPLWYNWIQSDLILREAETLIPAAPTTTKAPASKGSDDVARQERKARADRASAQAALALIRQDVGHADLAEKELRTILAERKALAAEEPANAEFRAEFADCSRQLGRLLIETGRWDDGMTELRQASKNLEQPGDHTNRFASIRLELAAAFLAGGEVATRSGNSTKATESYRMAVSLARTTLDDHSSNSERQKASAAEWLVLALAHARLNEFNEARNARKKAIELLPSERENLALRPLFRQVILGLGVFSPEAAELNPANAGPVTANVSKAIEQAPNDANALAARGDWFAWRGLWKLAAADYLAALQKDQSSDRRNLFTLKLATVYLADGDLEKHRGLCQTMLDQWGPMNVDFDASRILRASSLVPIADAEQVRWSRLITVLESGESRNMNWSFQLTKAMFEYRRGRYAEALAASRESMKRFVRTEPSNISAMNLCIEAMCLYRNGEVAEAARALAKARPVLEKRIPGVDHSQASDVHDWINAHLLLREASALLETKNPKGKE